MAGPSTAGAWIMHFSSLSSCYQLQSPFSPVYARICAAVEAQRAGAGLPIRQYSQQIVDTVKQNAVTVVIGETGSGKTTQIAQVRRYARVRRQLCNHSVLLPHALSAEHLIQCMLIE